MFTLNWLLQHLNLDQLAIKLCCTPSYKLIDTFNMHCSLHLIIIKLISPFDF